MHRIRKIALSLFLVFSICISCINIPSFATNATDATYVTSVAYYWKSEGDSLCNVVWNQNKNRYDIALADSRTATSLLQLLGPSVKDIKVAIEGTQFFDKALNPTTPTKATATQLGDIMVNKLPAGTTKDYSLIAGSGWNKQSKTYQDIVQRIGLHFFVKVTLSGLNVVSGDNEIELLPQFNYVTTAYVVDISDETQTITVNATPKTALAVGDKPGTIIKYTDDSGTDLQSLVASYNTFDVETLPCNDDGIKYINVTVGYSDSTAEVESTTYQVFFVKPEQVIPVVNIDDDRNLSLAKDTEYPLRVSVQGNEDYSYQWYSTEATAINISLNKDNIWQLGKRIDGATSPEYTPQTQYARNTVYWCDVTKDFYGVPFTTHSDYYIVNVEHTYACPPTITQQPSDLSASQGELVQFEISAKSQEASAYVSLEWELQNEDGSWSFVGNGLSTEYGNGTFMPDTSVLGEHKYRCAAYCIFYDNEKKSDPTYSDIVTLNVTSVPGLDYFSNKGEGTENNPYSIDSIDDIKKIKEIVESGNTLEGFHFILTKDIELPVDWEPIGNCHEGHSFDGLEDSSPGAGKYVNPFSGVFDGGEHTITIPKGGKCLFNAVRRATIKNLKVFGENIDGSALINSSFVDYGPTGDYKTAIGSMWTVDIDNVTLLKNSKTSKAGFLPGSGSGVNYVTIRNSVIEEGCIIGDEERYGGGGSFVSILNGTIENCVSYATVYGLGGLAGVKGQTMGPCTIRNSAFLGTLKSNTYAGGILGSGYGFHGFRTGDNTAPNTPVPIIQNCYVVADITGTSMVGGILGGDPSVDVCLGNGAGTIAGNYFYGTINAIGEECDAGGIVGYVKGYDKFQNYHDNYYNSDCGVENGIGYIGRIVYKDDPEHGEMYGMDKELVINDVCIPIERTSFADGTLMNRLNSAPASWKNWVQTDDYPVHSDTPVAYELEIVGDYPTEYDIGEDIDLSQMSLKLKWTDGKTTDLDSKCEEIKITGYDKNKHGTQTVIIEYGVASVSFDVAVLYPVIPEAPNTITVYFTLLGDSVHGKDGSVHTLKHGGLTTWISRKAYTIDLNSTVWDLLEKVAEESNGKLVLSNPSGNYIDKLTYDGVTLGELDNGDGSGWMYTLNGSHPLFGVAEQYLENGDNIIWHYTDDGMQEDGSELWLDPGTVDGKQNDNKTVSVELPKAVSDKADTAFNVETELGSLEISKEAMASIAEQAAGNKVVVEITERTAADIEKAVSELEAEITKEELADAVIVEVTVKSGDKQITNFGGAELTLELPISKEHEEGKSYKVIAISADGTVSVMIGTVKNGKMVIKTTHFTTFIATTEQINPFTDIAGNWAADAIQYAYANGLMQGIGNNLFNPAGTVTRGMVVTTLYRMEKEPVAPSENPFSDVEAGTWYTDAVLWAAENKIVQGYDGKFMPADTVTREQFAAMLYNYAAFKKYDVSKSNELSSYDDAASISPWALTAMQWANAEGLVTGRTATTLVPSGTATRAEMASLLQRFIAAVVK